MHHRWKTALLMSMIACVELRAEPVSASSNPFTFPPITRVIAHQSVITESPFFKQTGLRPGSRAVSFSWVLPGAAPETRGTITVYTLLGRVVARIPVREQRGTVTWNLSPSICRSGVFIARMSYGTHARNLKLMLWN